MRTSILVFSGFLLLAGALASPALWAQSKAPNIGLDEKLGQQAALDDVLKDEEGNDVTLRRLVDKPTLLVLNYFRCANICPLLFNGLVVALNEINLEPGKDFQVIAVSFDPTDTPEMAHEKQINYLKLMTRPYPPKAFRFLTGEGANTKHIADSIGYSFRATGNMYAHPAAIAVLTSKGIISKYIYGTTFLPADIEMAVDEAAKGEVRPTISRVLSFCYSYDPASRSYVFSLTRAVGAGVLLFAGGFVIYLVSSGRRRTGEKGK